MPLVMATFEARGHATCDGIVYYIQSVYETAQSLPTNLWATVIPLRGPDNCLVERPSSPDTCTILLIDNAVQT